MRAILALAVKDLRLLLRDKAGFVFAFAFPLVYAVFFGAIFSNVGGPTTTALRVAVVDRDDTAESRSFIASLDRTAELEAVATSQDDAVQSVRRGQRLAYIELPPGFGDQSDGMFWGQPPRITVGIDPSRQAEAGLLQGVLIKCCFERMRDMFHRPQAMSGRIDDWLERVRSAENMNPISRLALEGFFPALKTFVQQMPSEDQAAASQAASQGSEAQTSLFQGGWQPVVLDLQPVARSAQVKINSYAWSFPQGIIWGVMGCAAAFGISLVVERTSGTLVRLRMAPIARWQILAGKAGACLAATVSVMVLLLLLAALVFGVRPQSVGLLAAAVICISLGFVGIMMLLSVLGKTEQSAGGIGWSVLLVMAMIGGGMVPRMYMPQWMQTIGQVSPISWAIRALEGAIWRGFSPAEMATPCAVLLAVGVACFALGVRAFRWTS